jgi:hypothetical protein
MILKGSYRFFSPGSRAGFFLYNSLRGTGEPWPRAQRRRRIIIIFYVFLLIILPVFDLIVYLTLHLLVYLVVCPVMVDIIRLIIHDLCPVGTGVVWRRGEKPVDGDHETDLEEIFSDPLQILEYEDRKWLETGHSRGLDHAFEDEITSHLLFYLDLKQHLRLQYNWMMISFHGWLSISLE